MSTTKSSGRSIPVSPGEPKAKSRKPHTILTVAEPLEQGALAMLIQRVDPDARIIEFRTLAMARGWIETGGQPDLVIVQVEILGTFGDATVRMWKLSAPNAMLALYGVPDGELARHALAAGVDAMLVRTAEPADFAAALGFILGGNRYVSPAFLAAQTERDHHCAFVGACGWAMPLIDELPVGMFVLQGERVIYSNRYMVGRFGYTPEHLHKMAFWDPVIDPHKAHIRDAVLGWLRGEAVTPTFVTPILTRDGAVRWFESFHRVQTIGGGPAVVVTGIDITARMSAVDRAMTAMMTPAELANGIYLPGDQRAPAPTADGQPAALDANAAGGLTGRQRQVLGLLATGSSNKVISAELGISEATVKLHVHHILRALGVSNRTAAALKARRIEP